MTRISEIYLFASSLFEFVELLISFTFLCLVAWLVWGMIERKVRHWCRGGRA